MFAKTNIEAAYTYNEEKFNKIIDNMSVEIPNLTIEPSYYINGDNLIVTKGSDGNILNTSKTKDIILSAINANTKNINLPIDYKKCSNVNLEQIKNIALKENIKLAQDILDSKGCIISEFPLGTKPEKINFPLRNRIISGLSKGVLVVEAQEKSGTIITLDFALDQGRDIFAIPGNINSVNSYGTNDIIKQGAKLVTSWEEIVEEYK